jgi:hypothetical protein
MTNDENAYSPTYTKSRTHAPIGAGQRTIMFDEFVRHNNVNDVVVGFEHPVRQPIVAQGA